MAALVFQIAALTSFFSGASSIMLAGVDGVADLADLYRAARALGADAVSDPDVEIGDPRLRLQMVALVYGAAEAQAMNATVESGRLGVADPVDQVNSVVAEAAGLDDVERALMWMTWNANRVADLAAAHVEDRPCPELDAAVALATALQAVLSALAHRQRGDQTRFDASLGEALLAMRKAAKSLR